jgi:hypothetical protein
MHKRSALALAALVLGLIAIVPSAARAQEVGSATVVPVEVTGPPDQRLNLVILGDGYTASEQQKFRDQVDKHLNILWSIEPFKSYRAYFNVYRVEVPSGVSGITCDPDDGNVMRDTVFHLQFASRCPAAFDARGITLGTGGNAAVDKYAAMIPGVTTANRQVLILANTDTYGGIGGTLATTSGGSPQGPLITPHELGHSLGGLQDEYPESQRNVPGGAYTGGEPSSVHHTIQTVAQMLTNHTKWWRWIGDESESGGTIGAYESGNLKSSGIWRPSEHSIMRWIGNHYDQVGREKMTQRISGRRASEVMAMANTPEGTVGPNQVLWLDTDHPAYHELSVTWTLNGTEIAGSANSRNLELSKLTLHAGDKVVATAVVRDPALRDSASMTQTRTWTVGGTPAPAGDPVAPTFTGSTPAGKPVGRDTEVWVETTHPADHVFKVEWALDGQVRPNPANSFSFKLPTLSPGTHHLTATVTDPAGPGTDTRSWTIDDTDPTTSAQLSQPLVTLDGSETHNVYFEQFTMGLTTHDDEPGYVVGEFRLDHDGWFNYFGWPDAPDGTPYLFTPRGTVIKNLTYGSLGTGGMSKAPFEQSYPDFKPGYGTHTVEHHAIDAAGNTGPAGEFSATVLPGATPACTQTITGASAGSLVVSEGVTCLSGAHVGGAIEVRAGGSLVATNSTIEGSVSATGAASVQIIGSTVLGSTGISGSTVDVTLTGSRLDGGVTLTGNHSGDYGVKLAGNRVYVGLNCSGNDHGVSDFGAPNAVGAAKTGECGTLTTTPAGASTPVTGGVGGSVPATLSLVLGAPATFGAFTPGVERVYGATMAATVTSSAGDATLTVADPSTDHPGHLVNGAFALPQPLKAGGSELPATLQTYSGPVSNDALSIPFSQAIGANDALRTGTYAKTLTFTLSTTTP